MMNEGKKGAKTKKKLSLGRIFGGDLVIGDFVLKEMKLILVIFACIIVFISNRYDLIKKQSSIIDLKKELQEVEYERQTVSIEYLSKTLRPKIDEMQKQRNLNLETPQQPAFEIQYEKKEE